MHFLRAAAALFVFAYASTASAQSSSDILPFATVPKLPKVLVLDGPIGDRAPLSFTRALNQNPQITTLVLASPGGVLQAGLIIADKIHEKGLNTMILPDTECASACAFLFLAGKERLALGKLGVHQVSGQMDLGEAQLNLSDALEMLGRFQVSPEVTTRMLRTPAADMYWFSEDEKTRFGLNTGQEPAGESASVSAPGSPESDTIELKAARFVVDWINTSSAGSFQAIASSAPYAETVDYFGKPMTRAEVMDDKRRYSERWPIRTAQITPSSMQSVCSASICTVTGRYRWSVANPTKAKTLTGYAEFRYRLDAQGPVIILEEGGRVLSKEAR